MHHPPYYSLCCVLISWLTLAAVPAVAQPVAPLSTPDSAPYQYFLLDCENKGWKNYFALPRWTVQTTCGDCGVHVTGAPKVVSVEGADSSRLWIRPTGAQRIQLSVLLPTDGYVFFQLVKIGGSIFSTPTEQEVSLLINEEPLPIHWLPQHGFYTPFLREGDRFTLVVNATATDTFRLSDWAFYCRTSGVMVRDYVDTHGQAQADFISLPRPSIMDIVFTGAADWPQLDLDGDLSTPDDRYPLLVPNDQFVVEWDDQPSVRDGQPWLLRRWRINDPCTQNELHVNQWWQPMSPHSLPTRPDTKN